MFKGDHEIEDKRKSKETGLMGGYDRTDPENGRVSKAKSMSSSSS